MSFLKRNADYLAVLPVLAVAAYLRWRGFADWSLTNDELSALYGLSLETLSLTINDYVYNDMHPAGVQLFMVLWCKIFGTSVFSVRLPFVLAGIISVALTFETGKRFFSAGVGLLAASFFAIMQLPVLYTQLARPYSSGMLLVLWNAIAWHAVVNSSNPVSRLKYFHWVLTMALCLYNHYFSALVPVVLGFSGYFLIRKQEIKAYTLSGILSLVLFLPHLSLSIAQFSRGGIGTWLGPPDIRFFDSFFFSLFNENNITCVLVLVLMLWGLVKSRGVFLKSPLWVISLILFLFPLLLGYFYSIYVNPVLQPSILLFFVPFVLFALLAGFSYASRKTVFVISAIVLFWGSFTLIKINRFNPSERFATFSVVADWVIEKINAYGRDNIEFTMNIVNPYYLDYYFEQSNIKVPFVMNANKGGDELLQFRNLVNHSKKDYFLYTWTNSDNPLQLYPIIREKFPCLLERVFLFNTEMYLFSKATNCIDTIEKIRFVSAMNFQQPLAFWSFSSSGEIDRHPDYPQTGQLLKSTKEYSANFEAPLKDIIEETDDIIQASVQFKSYAKENNATLCISVSDGDELLHWSSVDLRVFYDSSKVFSTAYHAIRIPDIKNKRPKVKVYVANFKASGDLLLNNFVIKVLDGNPLLYGKRPKFSALPE